MSMLASLVRAYERLPDKPPFGYSSEKIGFCILLNPDGSVTAVQDMRDTDKKRSPRMMLVPQAIKRTSGIAPNFLWDKSSYVLGVTDGTGKRTAEEHRAFYEHQTTMLAGTEDLGLQALALFLGTWTPENFAPPFWPQDMLDQNIIFALNGERQYLHERPAAQELVYKSKADNAADTQICLVTGEAAPIERLHPSIKGVWGAQSSGASLVSFNLDAFTSYGHEQGDNAPVSEKATFAYTTALNRFLERDSHNRIQIGDASTVFWADCADMAQAQAADFYTMAMLGGEADVEKNERFATHQIGDKLRQIREGMPLREVEPKLADGVRIHLLGLAPNAARISVRFYWENDFGTLTRNYQRYLSDMRIDPPPRDDWPPLWRYLSELAPQGKRENIPPLIAGEWLRAIVAGTPYPMTLLSTTLMRIRADGQINALRVAMLKSVLCRNLKNKLKEEGPVALNPENTNKGYLLGRLFAVYEEVQRAALGGINATIKDKFYGAASASPQKVFRTLDAGSANHFSKLSKLNKGRAVNLEKLIGAITDLMDPSDDPIPTALNATEQALFGIGYYHQRSDFFRKHENNEPAVTENAS